MKKQWLALALAAAAAAGAAGAQEGWKFGGYLTAGTSFNVNDKVAIFSQGYKNGAYYGAGEANSRIRINGSYDGENGGIIFRYQAQGDFFDSGTWTYKNLKYAQAYAKLLDGLLVVEGGALVDRYTNSEGWEGFDFSDYDANTLGGRLVVVPVEGLAITAQVSNLHSDVYPESDEDRKGKVKLNENLFSFSAKYGTDAFYVAGGYHLAGDAYAAFGLKLVDHLGLDIEARYLNKDISGEKNGDGNDTDFIELVEDVEYDLADAVPGLSIGLVAYQDIIADATTFKFTPHAQYAFNDTYGAQLESTITYYKDADDGEDAVGLTVTPALCAKLTKSTKGRLFYTFERTNTKDTINYLGFTVRTNF